MGIGIFILVQIRFIALTPQSALVSLLCGIFFPTAIGVYCWVEGRRLKKVANDTEAAQEAEGVTIFGCVLVLFAACTIYLLYSLKSRLYGGSILSLIGAACLFAHSRQANRRASLV